MFRRINSFKKNRRGDVAIAVLVVLTLVLTGGSLFLFNTKISDISETSVKVGVLNDFGLVEKEASFFVSQILETVLVKTQREFIDCGEFCYIRNFQSIGGNAEFGELNSRWEDSFERRFEENLNEEFVKYSSEELPGNLEEVIADRNKWNLVFDGEKFVFSTNEFRMALEEEGNENLFAEYGPEFVVEFTFEEKGLHSFEKIYEAKENCKVIVVVDKVGCYEEKLVNFLVDVEESGGQEVVSLKSKKSFLNAENFEQIEINFIPV